MSNRLGLFADRPLANGVPTRRLDFLRGVAAVYVVIGHARGHLFAGGTVLRANGELSFLDMVQLALLQATSLGTEAVILFFVLSGFAMAHSIRYTSSTRTFYVKRALRIWPPYILAVLIAFALAHFMMQHPQNNPITETVRVSDWGWGSLIAMLLYADVDTVLTAQFWSLPQEVLFYMLCPLLLRNRVHVITWFVLACLLNFTGIYFNGIYEDPTVGGGIIYKHFFNLLIFFMTGALAYYYQHLIPRVSGRMLALATVGGFILIWGLKYWYFQGWNTITSFLTVPFALLLLKNVPASLYDRKLLNWGDASYSIYIFHMQLIMLIAWLVAVFTGLEQREMTSFWAWTLSVPPIIFACWVLYLISEKQSNNYLLRWRERDRAASEAKLR